jgi:hypothetical protein
MNQTNLLCFPVPLSCARFMRLVIPWVTVLAAFFFQPLRPGRAIRSCMLPLLSLSVVMPAVLAAEESRPNIVLILVDDMGYADISPYGGEIETPALASLAEGGLRFTEFHNTGLSAPPGPR